MFGLLATILAWFYSICHSYGLSIILLTLAIMIVLTPLTLKGTRSMMVMQALQPEMKKIQQRYKDDRQKLNEELLLFYKENKINPLGGCLPLLIQMPVFLVLYRVLRGLTNPKIFGVVLAPLTAGAVQPGFSPAYISHTSDLYQALQHSSAMMWMGIDLSRSAVQAVRLGYASALPYLVLIAGVVATSYYQQKQVQGRNPAAAAANPQQQMLLKVMPLFFAFISLNLPAALVLYFLVSNLYRVGQQAFISHRIYKPAQAAGLFEANATESGPDEKPKKAAGAKPVGAGTAGAKTTAPVTKGTTTRSTSAKPAASKPATAKPVEKTAATATAAGATAASAETKSGGFFGRLLGDSAPRLSQSARTNGGSTSSTSKGNGRPPAASRTTPGRTTPAGAGPQPRARKKKKRK